MEQWWRKLGWREWAVSIVISLVILWLAIDIAEWWLGHPVIPKD